MYDPGRHSADIELGQRRSNGLELENETTYYTETKHSSNSDEYTCMEAVVSLALILVLDFL